MKCPSCGIDGIEERVSRGEVRCYHCGGDWRSQARLVLLPRSLFNEGLAAAKIGDWERAEELLFVAVYLNANLSVAWLLLGKVLAHRSEHLRALSAWKRVLYLEPDNESAKASVVWARAILQDKRRQNAEAFDGSSPGIMR